jgi:hypothetical protein
MKSLERISVILVLCLCAAGCSGYSYSEHFVVINDSKLTRFEIHDWYEQETSGPSVGSFLPPIFGFEHNENAYAIYPVRVREPISFIGPPVVPFIPVALSGIFERDNPFVFRLMHFQKGAVNIEPKFVLIEGVADEPLVLTKKMSDSVGTIYSVLMNIPKTVSKFSIKLTLTDKTTREIQYSLSSNHMYSPLFSFNGPNATPKFTKHPAQ